MPYFIKTLCKTNLMHVNLRYLLCVTVLSICLPGIIRTLMDIARSYSPNYLFQITCLILNPIYSFTNGTASFGFLLIFIERFYATKRSETYESNMIPFITFFTIALVCVGLTFTASTMIYDRSPLEYPINEKSCLSLERRLWVSLNYVFRI